MPENDLPAASVIRRHSDSSTVCLFCLLLSGGSMFLTKHSDDWDTRGLKLRTVRTERGQDKQTQTAPEGPAYCRANPRSYRKTRLLPNTLRSLNYAQSVSQSVTDTVMCWAGPFQDQKTPDKSTETDVNSYYQTQYDNICVTIL